MKTTHDLQVERYTEEWVDPALIAKARENENEIASLLNRLRDAEADLASSEQTYEALRQSLAGNV